MLNRIRYRILMRRLRSEIADTVCKDRTAVGRLRVQKMKTSVTTACKACGNIV